MDYTPVKSHNKSREYALLPNPELGTLLQFASVLYDPKQREHVDLIVTILRSNNTIGKLLVLFEQCAEQDDLSNMRTLRGIFNTMLLWADTDMIQELIMEKHFLGVLGVLEFMSKRNLSYREQFKNMARIKLGSILKKDLVQKLGEIEHLEFFKSQVAPQYQQKTQLIQALDRLIKWKQLDIVNWIQQDSIMTQKLFRLLNKKDAAIDERRMTLSFMHKVFTFAEEHMECFARTSFISAITGKGLLDLIQQLLYDDDTETRILTVKLLQTITQSDVWIVQHHILSQAEKHKHKANILQAVMDQLSSGNDYKLKNQLLDITKNLLGFADYPSNIQSASGFTSQSIFDDSPVTGNLLKLFYERYAFCLIRTTYSLDTKPVDMINPVEPLDIGTPQTFYFSSLCEFLRLLMTHYGNPTKRIIQDPDCFKSMAQLFRHQDPSLKLKTLRFFRAAIGLRDTEVNAMLIDQNIFPFIIRLLLETNAQQHHTIHSEIEELLGFIRNMNMIILIDHIMAEFGSTLESTLSSPVYNSLRSRHEKNIADGLPHH